MGYRQYIVKIEKEKVDAIRHLSLEGLHEHFKELVEIDNHDNSKWLSIHDVLKNLNREIVVELGKYFDGETYKNIAASSLFINKEVNNRYEDYDLTILNEDAFLIIAEHFESKVKKHFDLLLTKQQSDEDFPEYLFDPTVPQSIEKVEDILKDEYIVKRIVNNFLTMRRVWKHDGVLNKDKDKEPINRSWYYEHEVFEMLRLYKTADFDKYYYIIYGY